MDKIGQNGQLTKLDKMDGNWTKQINQTNFKNSASRTRIVIYRSAMRCSRLKMTEKYKHNFPCQLLDEYSPYAAQCLKITQNVAFEF